MDLPIPGGWLPLVIFLARIADVTLGTLRTLAVVRGRTFVASLLGFVEVSIWIVVITKVIQSLDNPFNMLGWALGFATGNGVGILIERRLAMGHLVLRIISRDLGPQVAAAIRERGLRVVEFPGHEPDGGVELLYIVLERARDREVRRIARGLDPQCLIVTEDVRGLEPALRPFATPRTGWRAIAKRK
jgi:uncharacterized protein YebE (UPF0316 family)